MKTFFRHFRSEKWKLKLRSLKLAAIVFVIVWLIADVFTLPFNAPQDKNIISKSVLAIGFLVGGVISFRPKPVLFTVTRNSFKQIGYTIIPLTAIFAVNIFRTPTILINLHHTVPPISHLAINILRSPTISIDLSHPDVGDLILTGVWEEALFRGFLLAFCARIGWLQNRWGRLISVILLSGALFALFHGAQGTEDFIIRSGLGAIFAMVVLKTQTILFAVILHFSYDELLKVLTGNTNGRIDFIVVSVLGLAALFIISRMSESEIISAQQQE